MIQRFFYKHKKNANSFASHEWAYPASTDDEHASP